MSRFPDHPPAWLGRATRVMLRLSIVVSCLVVAILVIDLLGGPSLPPSIRPLLPVVLAVALCAALVIGVGAFGAPKRPSRREGAD